MASKRLDKLRQWAGEVISSKDKTVVTGEFKELENDIELRRKGIVRLQQASESYHKFLSKKTDTEALPDEANKLSPRDALGIVMISHGEEFGDNSAFGAALVMFGQGMCKTATLQETHALTLQSTFLASLQTYLDEVKEYQEQRKKLESRRLGYDATLSKLERLKGSKKEKDRQEAEEEMDAAKAKYEDTLEDVRARIHAIQEEEIDQFRALTGFLDMEIRYAENYLEVMKGIKADWIGETNLERAKKDTTKYPSHSFSSHSTPNSKATSLRSHKSSKSQAIELSDEEIMDTMKPFRRKSHSSRKSETEKTPSRPPSRSERKRSDSTPTIGEKDKADKARKLSVSGWASSAVSSMTGRGKKDKDNFVGLRDGEGETDDDMDVEDNASPFRKQPPRSKPNSRKTTPSNSPSIPIRILKTPFRTSSSSSLQDKKIVRALYDFSGSSEELSFKSGNEIVLLNEVVEGWWMGELDGKKGLFPITYTELIKTPSPSPPTKTSLPIPQRLGRWGRGLGGTTLSDEDDLSKKALVGGDDAITASLASDDDDHLFGDHNHLIANNRSPHYGNFDRNVNNTTEEDDDDSVFNPQRDSLSGDESEKFPPPPLARDPSFGKKAPPPPPPRRILSSSTGVAPPPLPDRKPANNDSQFVNGAAKPVNLRIPARASSTLELSPFESPTQPLFPTEVKRNPFNSRGM